MRIQKKEFIDRMSENGGITKKAARQGLELFMETLIDYLGEGDCVNFQGFGNFKVITTKERKARNIHDGKICIVPEHPYVKFHASQNMIEEIKEIQENL